MSDLCITIKSIRTIKGVMEVRIFSCETHINHALDMFVAEQKTFPMLEELKEEEKLSTICSYCENSALYIVANEN